MVVIINRWWQRPRARACHPTLSRTAQPVVFNPQPTKKHIHTYSHDLQSLGRYIGFRAKLSIHMLPVRYHGIRALDAGRVPWLAVP